FDSEQEILNELLQDKEEQRALLAELLVVWEYTDETVDDESAADMVLEQIDGTLRDIQDTKSLFESDSKFIQEELVEITSGVIFTNEVLENIDLSIQAVTKSLFSFDSPPLWKEFSRKQDTIVFREKRSVIDDSVIGFKDFYSQYSQRIWLQLFLALVIIILIFIIYRNLSHSIPESDTPEIIAVRKITERPLASGWLISIILSFILYKNVHESVFLAVSLLLLPPVIIILRAVITGHARKYLYLPLAAMVMVELHRIGYSETLLSRLGLVLIILFGLLTLTLVFGRKSQRNLIFKGRYGKVLMTFGFAGFIMLAIAFFSSITGAMILAEYLTKSGIESATIALFVYAVMATLN
ncbi:MAG: hypothetical protein KAT15_13295, partial [Bacteroidales bacterium]|nr:hypothetical protein [Bacteroidales bacterium]